MSNIDWSISILPERRRLASPSERRCITRQDIGHQRRLVIGSILTSDAYNEVLSLKHGTQPFYSVLKRCIDEHPILSTVILDGDTEAPGVATPKFLDLDAHLEIRDVPDESENRCIEKLMSEIGDEQFNSLHITPPWKVVLVSLPTSGDTSTGSRLLVLFTNYHSHGDGRSGLAFQNTFHSTLSRLLTDDYKDPESLESIFRAPTTPLLPPIEQGGKLTLSWSYLLSPLLGTYLPTSVASLFGLRTSWLIHEAAIWRGQIATFDPSNHSTGLVLVNVEPSTLNKFLQRCRLNETTLTGCLLHLIVRSLTAPDGGVITMRAFNIGVAIDMRHLFPGIYSSDSMLNCVTGYSELVVAEPLAQGPYEQTWKTNPSSSFWQAARKTSTDLRVAASTLHNQPIGLLQYLKAFRPWTAGQIGKERDTSFEISNLGAFSPACLDDEDCRGKITMERLVFSQPAKATGSLVNFNPVAIKGGPLTMTVTWQLGVLGLPEGAEEAFFMRKVCSKLESLICEIAALPLR